MNKRNGVKAATFLRMRNDLLAALNKIDADIDKVLGQKASNRTLAKARELFAERERVAAELAAFGVDVEAHPAVWSEHG